MKIIIGTALIALAIIGWRLEDIRSDSNIGLTPAASVASSAGPEWVSFESAIKEADATGRPSMVFVYADWCPWCQKTFRETFTDEIVLQYLKENYQVVKLNADGADVAIVMNEQTITEGQLSRILGATGLPAYVFLDSEGQPITRTLGFYSAESVMGLLKSVSEY